MGEKDFLGKGIHFPMEVNKATGKVVMASFEQSVKEAVYLILMTQRGERFVHPQFGSGILSYAFSDLSETRLNMIARELEDVLYEQEPRIGEVQVSIEPGQSGGYMIIRIDYTIAGTNRADNLVFPFFLSAAEGEEER